MKNMGSPKFWHRMTSSLMGLTAILGVVVLGFSACQDPPVPRPRGYFRIATEAPQYLSAAPECPVQFERAADSRLEAVRAVGEGGDGGGKGANGGGCWFNLAYPQWNARLHFTYLPVRGNLDTLLQEAHDMTFSHDIKSSGIGKRRFTFPEHDVAGLMFELDGPVATPLQFLATDSSRHFLRAALYFEHVPNPDSIAPAYQRIAADVVHLIETLEWKP